jgi:NADH:ubiquinone oxidoreductase subunit D
MRESLKILEQALKQMPPTGEIGSKKYAPFIKNHRNFKPPVGEAYGRVEAPKGELGFYVVPSMTLSCLLDSFSLRLIRKFLIPISHFLTFYPL